jgi:RNA polymerase sigma factor (sigma-70 family)
MPLRPPTMARVVRALSTGNTTGLSDRELLARFVADGDQAAFAAVAARHTGMVLGVCRRLLPCSVDAEDACQAVFLLLAEKAPRIRWQGSVAGWLYTVARRVARNARLSAERRARRESRAAVPESVAPVDAMTGRELAAVLDEELGRLPPRYRDPLVLCCLEGLTQDEAAARLGRSVETLRSQLKRGRKKLADALSARGCDLGIALLAVAASTAAASSRLTKSIHATATGSPSKVAILLARGSNTGSLMTHTKSIVLAATVVASALGLGAALTPPMSAQPPKDGAKPAVETVEALATTRIAATRFRADAPVGDARFSPDGKRIIGYAGGKLYVWNAADGSPVRTIDIKLELLNDPTNHREQTLAFAVHPKESRVAVGGVRDGKVILQVWDYETSKPIAEMVSPHEALKVLAWTLDGTRLVERTNFRWEDNKVCKLIVRDPELKEVRTHKLSENFGDWSTVMLPLPGSKEAVLWQSGAQPTVFDLETGLDVRTIRYTVAIPSDIGASPDGKTLAVTSTEAMVLLDAATGDLRHQLPVLRGGWQKPRPLFSPDGRTVYLWDHKPIAYDVATGKEKWRGVFRTVHTVAMNLCDVSPDGATLLCRHGHRVARLDAATGKELDPSDDPSRPADLTWSPDGKILFTRAERHERTWTAWDAATGKRLYELQPTGLVADNDWKMMPELFFIKGGKEIVAGLVKSESTERTGPRELLAFDTASGKCLRRLGNALPDDPFMWAHLVAIDPDGSTVVMQVYTISTARAGPGGVMQLDYANENRFKTIRWDTVRNTKLGEWDVVGDREEPSRHFGPFTVTIGAVQPDPNETNQKRPPAKLRCFSLADGKLVHEWTTPFSTIDVERLQGNFLLSFGYQGKWVTHGRTITWRPATKVAYDLWEVPSHEAVRIFELDAEAPIVPSPHGRFVMRVKDDRTVEIFEPFVLKKAIATVTPPARPEKFEFSPDGKRLAVSLADTSVLVWDTAPWLARIDEQLATAVPTDLGPLWDDLAGDATKGLRAACLLGAAGDKAVSLFKSKITARPAPDKARMNQLIDELDSSRFAVREKAEAELRDMSTQAEPHLKRAQKPPPSPEAAKRIESLLTGIATNKLSGPLIRELRAAQALEWMDTAAAHTLLAEWSKGDPAAALTKAATAAGR